LRVTALNGGFRCGAALEWRANTHCISHCIGIGSNLGIEVDTDNFRLLVTNEQLLSKVETASFTDPSNPLIVRSRLKPINDIQAAASFVTATSKAARLYCYKIDD